MARVQDIHGFEVLDTLGHGARSTIFLVKDKQGAIFALKRVARNTVKDERFIEQAIHEHQIAQDLDHETLRKSLKIIRSRQVIRVTEVYVVMEFVDGATLEQERPRSVLQLCEVMRQIAAGLHSMHESGYVHADLKPNNIMITAKGKVKIIDFGQSCKIGTVKDRIQGTPDYIAPEQVKRKEITPLTDVFNLGATMYWLLTNEHVPTLIPKGQAGLAQKPTREYQPADVINPDVPPALASLLTHCVDENPERRPATMADVHSRLGMAIRQLRRDNRHGKVIIKDDPRQTA